MNFSHLYNFKKQFDFELPGSSAQDIMSPIKNSIKYREVPEIHKVACVMALFHPKDGEMFVTFIKRASSHPKDKHAGQIGFPGGKYEEEDEDLLTCALRETEEEIGIPTPTIEILGQLTSLYVFASNFLVHPFVGLLHSPPSYVRQDSEVADVIEVPASTILDPTYKMRKKLQLSEGTLHNVPGYNINGDFLWGATAMMTSELEIIMTQALRP